MFPKLDSREPAAMTIRNDGHSKIDAMRVTCMRDTLMLVEIEMSHCLTTFSHTLRPWRVSHNYNEP